MLWTTMHGFARFYSHTWHSQSYASGYTDIPYAVNHAVNRCFSHVYECHSVHTHTPALALVLYIDTYILYSDCVLFYRKTCMLMYSTDKKYFTTIVLQIILWQKFTGFLLVNIFDLMICLRSTYKHKPKYLCLCMCIHNICTRVMCLCSIFVVY